MADFSQDQIDQIREMIREEISNHRHDGSASPQIDPMFLLGFPIYTAAVPSHAAPDGTVILTDVAGTRKIYARISGAWYSVAVT